MAFTFVRGPDSSLCRVAKSQLLILQRGGGREDLQYRRSRDHLSHLFATEGKKNNKRQKTKKTTQTSEIDTSRRPTKEQIIMHH